MKRQNIRCIAAVLAFTVVAQARAQEAGAQPYKKGAGPFAVETVTHEWVDQQRNREVPVRLYFPETGEGPFPVIIFSHGLGGSRDGYEYLGRHWASNGYVSVHLQHKGSDAAVWQGKAQPMQGMRDALADPQNAIARPADVRFAIDQMTKLNADEAVLKGRLDLARVGMAGHSFGAYTTLAIAGQVFTLPSGEDVTMADPRIKAAIPMSAPAPRRKDQLDRAFAKIAIPCLHMTGTLDDSPIAETTAKERRIPFDHSSGSDQYLVTFEGGDHMIFSGRGRQQGGGQRDALFQDLICQSTTAFWDAYLKGDAKAKAWLAEDGFAAVMGKDGKSEVKLKGK